MDKRTFITILTTTLGLQISYAHPSCFDPYEVDRVLHYTSHWRNKMLVWPPSYGTESDEFPPLAAHRLTLIVLDRVLRHRSTPVILSIFIIFSTVTGVALPWRIHKLDNPRNIHMLAINGWDDSTPVYETVINYCQNINEIVKNPFATLGTVENILDSIVPHTTRL
jgi:hypothetical protein